MKHKFLINNFYFITIFFIFILNISNSLSNSQKSTPQSTHKSNNKIPNIITDLTNITLNYFILGHKYTILELYNPASLKSKYFEQDFNTAAHNFTTANVSFARINAELYENDVRKDWEFVNLPAIYWINSSSPDKIEKAMYFGELNTNELIEFINRKFNFKIELVNSFNGLKKSTFNYKNSLLLIGNKIMKEDSFDTIAGLAVSVCNIKNVYWTDSDEFKKLYNISIADKDSVDLVFYYDLPNYNFYKYIKVEENNEVVPDTNFLFILKMYSRDDVYSEIKEKEFNFMKQFSFPSFICVYDKVESSSADIYSKNNELYNSILELEKEYKYDLAMFNTTIDNEITKDLLSLFRVKKHELPVLLIFYNKMDEIIKHKYIFTNKHDITKQNIKNFINNWKSGIAERFFKSEELTEEDKLSSEQQLVQKVVGVNFNTFADQRKDIILFFVDRREPKYFLLKNVISRVANKITPNNKKIVFGEVDLMLNEFDSIEIDTIPTMIILEDINENVKERLTNVIYFNGEFSTLELVKFISKNVNNKLKDIIVLKDESQFIEEEKINPILINEDINNPMDQDNIKEKITRSFSDDIEEEQELPPLLDSNDGNYNESNEDYNYNVDVKENEEFNPDDFQYESPEDILNKNNEDNLKTKHEEL